MTNELMQIGCTCPECEEHFLITVRNTDVARLEAQITDLHALAESNTATIDRLLSEVQALRALADTQAAIIDTKNAEIAQMKGDYAGALVDDAELTGDVLAASQGAQ